MDDDIVAYISCRMLLLLKASCSLARETNSLASQACHLRLSPVCVGDTIKLFGESLKLDLPSVDGNMLHGQDNDLGYGKNGQDVTMGNPQPSPKDDDDP